MGISLVKSDWRAAIVPIPGLWVFSEIIRQAAKGIVSLAFIKSCAQLFIVF